MENSGYVFNWQRQFIITDHIKHKNGFTLYKVTSVVFPKKHPEAGTKIVVWKRYNQFKKLYKELKQRHSSLHIGEELPSLPKSVFFDRFSEQVIKERKDFIFNFLNFVAKCPSLFTADIFVKFFQEGYSISEYDNKTFNKNEISIDKVEESNVDSFPFVLKFENMGQVLNSEGSQSSDESSNGSISKKLNMRSGESLIFSKLNIENYEKNEFVFRSRNAEENNRSFLFSRINNRDMPAYWEEAVAHADEAHQQEILGNYEVSFAMYKTAIICLLSGVQGNCDVDHRKRVKELTSQYILQAEWIYNNYLVFQNKPSMPKLCRIPWRSRSQLKRYKVLNVLNNNLLVHDVDDDIFVIIKGVLKSNCPLDRSEICVLPKDVPYMVKLLALHETETTIFFVLEHIRYGKLWNHLEHYFTSEYAVDNLDTEITTVSPQDKEEDTGSDRNSLASSGSSVNNQSLSRLESSMYTDTISCESLSSHDENYFDLIEDYARAKSQKLKEIQDFNERRKHVESMRPVKKTVSQVDLKSMDDNYEHPRSQSLTNLAHENEDDNYTNSVQMYKNVSNDSVSDEFHCPSDEENADKDIFNIDMDTQQLLKNAQKLIESINETLSKSENVVEERMTKSSTNENILNCQNDDLGNERNISVISPTNEWINQNEPDTTENERKELEKLTDCSKFNMTEMSLYSTVTPLSDSVPSVTEEYSITAVLQRDGITNEIIKKWAAQILIAVDILHKNGIICRDLNPNNILLTDNGSVKLTYFFRYPNVDPFLSTYAMERLYVAPEINNINSTVTFSSDWWSFGAILYELVTLQSLYGNHPAGINSHTIINIPDKVQFETRSLLLNLLRYDPNERLGSGISGADDIKSHPYFAETNWEEISL